MAESLEIVAICRRWIGEFDGYISVDKGFRVEVLLVVGIDFAYNFVATLQGNLFNHVSHFAVANQCYFHCLIVLNVSFHIVIYGAKLLIYLLIL